ncbi:helix-turn-helix transcriptional regulator [Defluviimonas sp. WL0024]|uniref:Helix-turn-helix transcriptional regulator n=2 Tax=Albidovulum TaxID=205889 RepID=A0ABT3JA38_9RHOB|nr:MULTISPECIES: helix-turn-helix domain-containing protein [Defluviimonas]MCU9848929.1 helix-turn-helix transcriptional regulator [Defluviimonas sp. WL0024]MCW3784564.1 helix-turn-helix transcriptional regulator [Defluviimonas salinarum]
MPQKPYGMLCPIAKACEILVPRWSIQILTELWSGSTRFNDIRRGIGSISPGLLSKRLKELEAAGLVERIEDKAAGTVDYIRTDKAIALEPALNALAVWAQRYIEAEIALCDTNLSTLMWKIRRWIDVTEMPDRRVVIRFHFSDDDLPYDTYWMVIQPDALPELCTSDPGCDVDLYIETEVISLAGILIGRSTIARETDRGSLFVSGDARLARTMDRWLPVGDYGRIDGIATLPTKRRA